MNIDQYISSYLDGELHPEDDAVFRALLSEYPELREEFEVAVNIHIAMKSIADDIAIPDDLFTSTAHIVEEMARKEEVALHTLITNSRLFSPLVKRASLVMALLLVLAVKVDDYWFNRTFDGMATLQMISYPSEIESSAGQESYQFVAKSVNSNNEEDVVNSLGVSKLGLTTQDMISLSSTNVVENRDSRSDDLTGVTYGTAQEDEIQDKTHVVNEQDVSASVTSASLGVTKSLQPTFSSSMQEVYSNSQAIDQTLHFPYNRANPILSPNVHKEDIRLSTFATTLLSTSQKSILSTSISQGFDFPLTNESSIGLEIGTITRQDVVTNQQYTGASYSSGDASGGGTYGQSKVLGGSTESGNSGGEYGSLNSTPKNYIKSMYWAAISIDYSVLQYDLFQLHTRLGIGAANDGPILLGRVYGSFDIYKQVSLTAGLDSRYFMINSIRNGFSTGSAVSTISLMYGIQIRL
jgi:hypothetical protein